LFAFLLGFFRLGFIDVVLSRALLRGFISAIAVVILTEQLVPMFGLTALLHQVHPESTLDKMFFLLEHVVPSANATTTLVSFSALAVLVGLRVIKGAFQKYWWIYRLPEVLIVVVLSTSTSSSLPIEHCIVLNAQSQVLSDEFNWDQDGVEILGSVPITSMKHFVQIPLQAVNLKYLRRTTSTAMFVQRSFHQQLH
jgi:MFS superfamily sulfate permease-like transporter